MQYLTLPNIKYFFQHNTAHMLPEYDVKHNLISFLLEDFSPKNTLSE